MSIYIRYYMISYHVTLYYIILHYITLYYIILHYITLYYHIYISSTIHITYSILFILSFVFCIKTTSEYIMYHIRYILFYKQIYDIAYCILYIVYSITCNFTYIIYVYIYIITVFDNNSRVIRTQCSKQSWLVAMPPQMLGFCEFPRVAGWQIRFNFSFNKKVRVWAVFMY